jgi:hypothetical protein
MTFAWSIPARYTHEAFQSQSFGYQNPDSYDRWPVELWGTPADVREGLHRHTRVIREVAREERTLLLDQEGLMGADLRWFGDICHFNDEGTARFIENIADFLVQQRLFDRLDQDQIHAVDAAETSR